MSYDLANMSNRVEAAKKRWENIPPEERSRRMRLVSKRRWEGVSKEDRKNKMSEIAKIRMAKMSKKERYELAMKMVNARKLSTPK